VAVSDGLIAGVGEYHDAADVIDADGQHLVPGFINAHCHIESSMLSPADYCAAELMWGVTTIIADPHEVANVAGIEGIRYMLDAIKEMPINCHIQAPSSVPATGYETSGALLDAEALKRLFKEPGVMGLGEVMDFIGVLDGDQSVLSKLAIARGRVIDGHAPGLSGPDLCGYSAAGIHTDHESFSFSEAREKLRAGIAVLIREGSSARNLEAIVSGIVKSGIGTEFTAFCSDDRHWADIMREGTVSCCIRNAIALGLPPSDAYKMGTINAARIYRLWDIGAIAPGYRADMVLLRDYEKAEVDRVFKDGRIVDIADRLGRRRQTERLAENSVRIPSLTLAMLELPTPSADGCPVVGIIPGQIVTRKYFIAAQDVEKALKSGDLCKLAVIERHRATGNIGVGLLGGYGLKEGAVASTIAHDSHNLIVAGGNDADMLLAAEEVRRIQGGFALAQGGEITASLPLPVYGLMTDQAPEEFIPAFENLLKLLHGAGVGKDIDPLITLSFMALPVIPEIRVTDKGVFDVNLSRFI
jgi:adenine deaminase